MNLRAALELIRLPAVFTAPSDVLAGAAVAAALGADLTLSVVILCVASAAIYCAGMAANDLFDVAIDRIERPGRPIPSGRASVRGVWALVLALQGLGLGLAALVGPIPVAAVAATLILTYLYNGVLKTTFVGPFAMGACRYGNFLIGASLLPWPWAWVVFLIPVGTLLYVVGLTWVSRYEMGDAGPPVAALALLVLCSLSPLLLYIVGALPAFWGGLLALLTPAWLAGPILRVRTQPNSGTTRGVVMAGIFGIAMVNGAIAMAAGAPVLAAISIGLLVPGRFVGRWFYAT